MDYFDCAYFDQTYFDTPDCNPGGKHAVGLLRRPFVIQPEPDPLLVDDEDLLLGVT